MVAGLKEPNKKRQSETDLVLVHIVPRSTGNSIRHGVTLVEKAEIFSADPRTTQSAVATGKNAKICSDAAYEGHRSRFRFSQTGCSSG